MTEPVLLITEAFSFLLCLLNTIKFKKLFMDYKEIFSGKSFSGFRSFYDKDLEFFINEQKQIVHESQVYRRSMSRLRMYAQLFIRDVTSFFVSENSYCLHCGTTQKLSLDHIIPISKGGKNSLTNIQILCIKCNIKKGNKIL